MCSGDDAGKANSRTELSAFNVIAALAEKQWKRRTTVLAVKAAHVTSPQCLTVAQRMASQLKAGCATRLFQGQTVLSASQLRPAVAGQGQEGRERGPRAVPVVQI